MAERHDLPRIIPDKAPSIFNREMADGAIWGSLLSVVALLIPKLRSEAAMSVLGAVIGGLIGGYHGKKREQREQIEGKVVKEPGIVNDGMLGGLALGMVGTDIVDMMRPNDPRMGIGVRLLGYFVPGIIGGFIGREHMKKEVKQAEAAKAEAMQQLLAAPLSAPTFKNNVTLEEIMRLEQQKNAPKSHATAIAIARDEAAEQPKAVGV